MRPLWVAHSVLFFVALIGITRSMQSKSPSEFVDWNETPPPPSQLLITTSGSPTFQNWSQSFTSRDGEEYISHGKSMSYYVDSGLRRYEVDYWLDQRFRQTLWKPDGSVDYQRRWVYRDGEYHEETKMLAPWWWGATAQTSPTSPWPGGQPGTEPHFHTPMQTPPAEYVPRPLVNLGRINRELRIRLQPLLRPAIALEARRATRELSVVTSHLGGTPYALQGETWPICPACNTGLNFIGQFDVSSLRRELGFPFSFFTFFYCWECLAYGDDYVEVEIDTEESKLTTNHLPSVSGQWVIRGYDKIDAKLAIAMDNAEPDESRTTVCTLQPQCVKSLPDMEGLDRYDDRARELSVEARPGAAWWAYELMAAKLSKSSAPYSWLGGYPHWIQSDATPNCRKCSEEMRLLLQLDTMEEAGLYWGDGGCVYLFLCDEHPEEVWLDLQCM